MPPAPRESGKVSARLPYDLIHGMQVVVQRLLSPYETTSDLMRHYIEDGLARDAAANPDDVELQELAGLVDAKRRAERADRYRNAQHVVEGLSRSIRDARSTQDERWIGDTREAAMYFIQNTPFPSLAEKLRFELDY